MNTNELNGKLIGFTNSNNYLSDVCKINPALAPILQVVISKQACEIECLKKQIRSIDNA